MGFSLLPILLACIHCGAGAQTVYIFDNTTHVNVSGSTNVKAILDSHNKPWQNFSNIDNDSGWSGDIVIVPNLIERLDSMSDAMSAIRSLVSNGGLLIVGNSPDRVDDKEKWLKDLFGFTYTTTRSCGSPIRKTADARDISNVKVLEDHARVSRILTEYVGGFVDLYVQCGDGVVSVVPSGLGLVVLLGFDFSERLPGWSDLLVDLLKVRTVLGAAVAYHAHIFDSPSDTNWELRHSTKVLFNSQNVSWLGFSSLTSASEWSRDIVIVPGAAFRGPTWMGPRRLAASVMSAIRRKVSSGGLLILGYVSPVEIGWVTDLFGWSLTTEREAFEGTWAQTPRARDLPALRNLPVLENQSYAVGISIESLPAGSVPLYTQGNCTLVSAIPYGSGLVVVVGNGYWRPLELNLDNWNSLLTGLLSARDAFATAPTLYCNASHDGLSNPCNLSFDMSDSDYCCDELCTYCGPPLYCQQQSPFNSIGQICRPDWNAKCPNYFQPCVAGATPQPTTTTTMFNKRNRSGFNVSFFDHHRHMLRQHSFAMREVLKSLGVAINSFWSTTSPNDWVADIMIAYDTSGTMIVLAPSVKEALRLNVARGALLIVGRGDTDLLARVFGLYFDHRSVRDCEAGTWKITASARGMTSFRDVPTLQDVLPTVAMRTSLLPSEAIALYEFNDCASVIAIPFGSGMIVTLGYDWSSASKADWNEALFAALSIRESMPTTSTTTVGLNVSFFDSSNFTSPSASALMTFALRSGGVTVNPFADVTSPSGWVADIVVVPEITHGQLWTALTTSVQEALRNSVAKGAILVVGRMGKTLVGDCYVPSGCQTVHWVPEVFGGLSYRDHCGNDQTREATANARGLPFFSDIPTVRDTPNTVALVISSLPAEAMPLYVSQGCASVIAIPYGTGTIVMLGFDWFGNQEDWNAVLLAALRNRVVNQARPLRQTAVPLLASLLALLVHL